MSERYSIKDIEDVIIFGLLLTNAIDKAQEDGNIDWKDTLEFVKPISALPAALNGITEIPQQFEDMDEDERAHLINVIKLKADLEDEKAELIIEQSFRVGVEIGALIATIRS